MKSQWGLALLSVFFPLTAMAALTTVTPKAVTGPLTNPGIGVASFHQGYGETLGWRITLIPGLNMNASTGGSWSLWKASTILRWLMMPSHMRRRIGPR